MFCPDLEETESLYIFDQDAVTHLIFLSNKTNRKKFANPFVASSRGFIDDIILPKDTRKKIISALNMLKNKKLSNPWKKHDNIPL